MNLDSALKNIKKCNLPNIQKNEWLQVITDDDFYLPPPIREISDSGKGPFILFSSPGAVGKTTLARYIARQYNGLYWNVATDVVTSNSFAGAVAHAFGVTNGEVHSLFYENLRNGEALVVLDAFDEAILLSRREGVQRFLTEIGQILSGSENCSVILTARTDTAKFIAETFKDNNYNLRHYAIEYFDDDNIIEFITGYLKKHGVVVNPKDTENIRKYVNNLKGRISARQEEREVKEVTIRRFMGYAQVLMLLSCQIEQVLKKERNTYRQFEHLLENLNDEHIIYYIIQELLLREEGKLDNFKNEIREKYKKINKEDVINSLYSKDEQLIRLQWYEQSDGDIPGDIVPSYKQLLPEDQEKYLTLLNEWLPQHIFLHNKKIMPIFQEYILAECLLDSKKCIDDKAFIYRNKLPTLAFAECYLSISGGMVRSNHIYFLVAAYYSQTTVDNQISCDISSLENDENETDSDLYLNFDYLHPDGFTRIMPIKISNAQSHPITLNQVENMSINISGELILASGVMENVEVRQSIIECDKIRFQAKDVYFSTYGDEENIIIVHDSMERDDNCKIRFLGTKNTKAYIPRDKMKYIENIYEFQNRIYDYEEGNSSNEESIENFAFGLKKVLEQFKTDKYDNGPRKLSEKIDAICQTGFKKSVLDFLKEKNALSLEGVFYQYNSAQMNKLRINRAAYMHINDTRYREQLSYAYSLYLQCINK